MIVSASSGTTSQTTCSMISRDSLAIASYSGPRAATAAILCSTADATATAKDGDDVGDAAGEDVGDVTDAESAAEIDGGAGVGALRVAGRGAEGCPVAGAEVRETTGLVGVGTMGAAIGGGGSVGLLTTGTAGADGVGSADGREGRATAGAAGVGRAWGEGTMGAGAGTAAGLLATGGFTDGKPIMVRLSGGRGPPPGAGAGADGCGVVPVRTAGMAADGRAPGMSDGRGEGAGSGAAAAAGLGVATGRATEGLVGGLDVQLVGTGAGADPRSMVISP